MTKELRRTVYIGILNRLVKIPEIEKHDATKKALINEREKCLSQTHAECYLRLLNTVEVLIPPQKLLEVYFNVARIILSEHHVIDLEKIEDKAAVVKTLNIESLKDFIRDNFLVYSQSEDARKKHTARIRSARKTPADQLKRIIALIIMLGPTGQLGPITDSEIMWFTGISTKLDTIDNPSEVIVDLQKKYPLLLKLKY